MFESRTRGGAFPLQTGRSRTRVEEDCRASIPLPFLVRLLCGRSCVAQVPPPHRPLPGPMPSLIGVIFSDFVYGAMRVIVVSFSVYALR